MIATSRKAIEEIRNKMIKKTYEINKNIQEGTFKFKEVRKTSLDHEESIVNYKFDKNK